MKNYYEIGKNLLSRLRSYGYNITLFQRFSWVTFYIDGEFLFSSDLQLLPEKEIEEIILELLKEKTNVHIPPKN